MREAQRELRQELRGLPRAERAQRIREQVIQKQEARRLGQQPAQATQTPTTSPAAQTAPTTQALTPAQQRQARALQQQQDRVQRLQERVQRLQAQQPQSARAQRAQQRLLQAQQRVLAREQRALERQQALQQRLTPAVTTGAAAAGVASRISPEAAARGRFAARYASANPATIAALQAARAPGWAPRHHWRRGLRALFVPWIGGLFYPYAYSDIFTYTFWPYAYDDGYWAYVYDDFFDTVFWGSGSPYADYAAYPVEEFVVPGRRPSPRAREAARTVQDLCGDPEKGITAWPFAAIEQAVGPNAEQRALLNEMKAAAHDAAEVFKRSCGGSFPMTPPGRLAAMLNRINATLEAVRIVRPPLERFYNSLNDEQKARFNAVGPDVGDRTAQRPQQTAGAACGEAKPGLTNLPLDHIEQAVRPSGPQQAALGKLREATDQALNVLQAACPDATPLTPVGRLEAMEHRLGAMAESGRIVQPALDEFYTSLNSEQKARFNAMRAQASR